MRAIIIGSGIGGLSTAVAFRRVEVDVTVYERAPALTEVGAGISLWATALHALDYIGAGPAVRAVALRMDQSEFRVRDGYRVAAFRRVGTASLRPLHLLAGCLPAPVAYCQM